MLCCPVSASQAGLEQKVLPSPAALPEVMAELGTEFSFLHFGTLNFARPSFQLSASTSAESLLGKRVVLIMDQGK